MLEKNLVSAVLRSVSPSSLSSPSSLNQAAYSLNFAACAITDRHPEPVFQKMVDPLNDPFDLDS